MRSRALVCVQNYTQPTICNSEVSIDTLPEEPTDTSILDTEIQREL
jgi:hypothetical protein